MAYHNNIMYTTPYVRVGMVPTCHAYKMAQNYQMWQLQALLDTLTYSLSSSVPSKYVKYTATMIYGNWPNSTSVHHHYLLLPLLIQLNWPTTKLAQVLSLVIT